MAGRYRRNGRGAGHRHRRPAWHRSRITRPCCAPLPSCSTAARPALVLFGEGRCWPELEEEAQAIRDRLRASSSPGYVNDPAAVYAAADLFALTSLTEELWQRPHRSHGRRCPSGLHRRPARSARDPRRRHVQARSSPSATPKRLAAPPWTRLLDNPPSENVLKSRAADFAIDRIGDRYKRCSRRGLPLGEVRRPDEGGKTGEAGGGRRHAPSLASANSGKKTLPRHARHPAFAEQRDHVADPLDGSGRNSGRTTSAEIGAIRRSSAESSPGVTGCAAPRRSPPPAAAGGRPGRRG